MAKPELRDHRKFLKLKRLLNAPTPHVIGYLDCLWHRGYQTGSPFVGDSLDVEAAAEYPGEPGTFTEAAFQSGFIDRDESGGYTIHDLYEHAPKYAKQRMHRRGTAPKVDRSGHGVAQNGPRGPENDKNETARSTSGPLCAGLGNKAESLDPNPKAESLDPKTENQEQAREVIPGPENPGPGKADSMLVGNGPIKLHWLTGAWHGITDQQRSVWSKAFPAVDIDSDLAKSAAWCLANPKEGRKGNYARFLTNWMQRTQDGGGNRGGRSRDSPKGTDRSDAVIQKFLANSETK